MDRRWGHGPHGRRPLDRDAACPTPRPAEVVILDSLRVHKSAEAARILTERGAWFMFLPVYSPDLNQTDWPSPG